MVRNDLIATVQRELKSLTSKLDDDDYEDAIDEALRDTGWAFPVTTNFKIQWLKRRTKRHIFYALMSGTSSKYKFEEINSQQQFEHYRTLVKDEDEAFEKIQESETYEFAGVSALQMFGHKIDAGFAYDRSGKDVTYDEDNLVIIEPSHAEE